MLMNMRYILFTSPFCAACRPVKEFLNSVNIDGEIVDAAEDSGSEVAVKYSVMKLPTVIFLDSNRQEICRCHSIGEIKEIIGD